MSDVLFWLFAVTCNTTYACKTTSPFIVEREKSDCFTPHRAPPHLNSTTAANWKKDWDNESYSLNLWQVTKLHVKATLNPSAYEVENFFGAFLLHGKQDNSVAYSGIKNKNRWNIHIQTTPLNSHARQRRGRRDWNISLSSMIFF